MKAFKNLFLAFFLLFIQNCTEPSSINIKLLKNVDGIYYNSQDKPFTGEVYRTYSDNSGEIWISGRIENGNPTTYKEPVETSKINIRDLLVYTINSDTPFSGHIIRESNGIALEEGSFFEGKLHGKILIYYPSGQIKSSSQYSNGEEILSNLYYENGQLEKESIPLDENSILVKEYSTSGSVISESNFKNLKLHGISKSFYPGGELKYEKNYLNGELSGKTIFYSSDGTIERETSYLNDSKNGLETIYNVNGQINSTTTYVDGKTQGPYSTYYLNGQLEERGEYELYGLNKGLLEKYYDTGQLKFKGTAKNYEFFDYEEYYLSGALKKKAKDDDNYVEYFRHPKHEGFEIQYVNGKPYKGFEVLELGLKDYEVFYISEYEDYILKSQEFRKFDYDVLIEKGFEVNKERDGVWESFYYNGALKIEATYKNGELNGPYKSFHMNGKIASEGKYYKGEIDSDGWKEYNEMGQPLEFVPPSSKKPLELSNSRSPGTITLKCLVNEMGRVVKSEYVSGDKELLISAQLLLDRFNPATIDKKKKAVWITLPLTFTK